MVLLPPILPPRPPYRSGEDPEREGRLAQLNQDYYGSPWLTVLVYVSGFVAVFAGSLVAVGLVANLGSGAGGWGPYALILCALVGTHLGLRVLRQHRRRAAGAGPVQPPIRPGRPGWLRRRRSALPVLAVIAAVVAGLLVASPWERPVPVSPEMEQALTAVLGWGGPGVVAVVRTDGDGAWTEAKGFANLDSKVPMRPGDRFRIASVTKTFVATVVLQLVADGRLGLDDPVARHLPGLLRDGARITVRQLLDHTSGLADSASLDAVHKAGDTAAVPPGEQVHLADARPRTFAPGTGWAYTNTGYLVLGLLVEQLTGQDLGQVLATRLFRPLHLAATSLEPEPGIPAGIAHGYRPGFSRDPVDVTEGVGGGAWAAGAIVSTADDVARFYAALLSGRVLPAGLLDRMRTAVPVTFIPQSTGYGLGLLRFALPCGTAWGHEGNLSSYRAAAYAAPDGHRVAVVLVNGFTGQPGTSEEYMAAAMQGAAETAYCRGSDHGD